MTHKLFSNRWLMAAVLLVLPLVLQSFGNAWVRIADMSLLYVLLALGLNIVVGYAGLVVRTEVATTGKTRYAVSSRDANGSRARVFAV